MSVVLLSGLPVQAQLSPPANRGGGLHGNAALIERRCTICWFQTNGSNSELG